MCVCVCVLWMGLRCVNVHMDWGDLVGVGM